MGNISILIDESGTFTEYDHKDPYYIVTLIFHDQQNDISKHIETLKGNLSQFTSADKAIHTGPIIRREKEYRNMDITERIRIFNLLFYFARRTPFCYKTIVIEKKQLKDSMALYLQISKQLTAFLKENLERFTSYEKIIVYYDSGQGELTKIILSVFEAIVGDIDYRKSYPSDYRLLQVADLICTMQLLSLKHSSKTLSESELNFFDSSRKLKKTYLTILKDKAFPENL